jgi:hypothetical protein
MSDCVSNDCLAWVFLCRKAFASKTPGMSDELLFFPAIIRSEHEAVIDALAALDIPRGEAMNLSVAGWGQAVGPILAEVDGGRPVAAVPLLDGRWAACNTFPGHACKSLADAERTLSRLLKRGRRGLAIGVTREQFFGQVAPKCARTSPKS